MRAQRILAGLNPAQRSAVEHEVGPLLIVAGAGTGKTRVVTCRVARLVEKGVSPERILAITFTNKAAREMRDRVEHWLPGSRVWISTFHAFAARVLRQDGEAAGVPRDFGIVDRDDQLALLRRVMKELRVADRKLVSPSAVLECLSRWKLAQFGAEGAAGERSGYLAVSSPVEEAAARVQAAYVGALQTAHLLDFDDLLLRVEQLLGQPAAGWHWRQRFLHVLIDEYQDTNDLQCRMVGHLAEHGNLAVCGDPDQSIYAWRGADVSHILRFEQDHPGTRVVRLEANYRSTAQILAVASASIRHNEQRIERELVPDRPRDGPVPRYFVAGGESQEAFEVVAEISTLLQEQGLRPGAVAIVYRTHALSRPFESALRAAGIPYRLLGAVAFYARKEIKDLLAYLRLRVQPYDSEAFVRAVGVPVRGIGVKSQVALIDRAHELGRSVIDVVRDPQAWPRLRGAAARGLQQFAAFLDGWLEVPADDLVALLRALIDRLDFEDVLESWGEGGADRMENVRALLADAHDFQQQHPHAELRDYLEQRALVQDGDSPGEGIAGEVQMMTLHSAKGLEFDAVFLCGLEDQILPHRRSLLEGTVEEERRLFYVGLTRAKRWLVLSSASYRFQFGRTEPALPSRFLAEIPEDLLHGVQSAWSPRPDPLFSGPESAYLELDSGAEDGFQSGDSVRHETFGTGRILEVLGSGERTRVRVRFAGGERVLSVGYTRLRKVQNHEY